MTNERQGYTLSDRGSWLVFSQKSKLQLLVKGDKQLFNPYGEIMVNPNRHQHVKAELAMKFQNYLISVGARKQIPRCRRHCEPLFSAED